MVGVLCKDAVSALLKGGRETRVAITVATSVKILHERRQSSNVLDKIRMLACRCITTGFDLYIT